MNRGGARHQGRRRAISSRATTLVVHDGRAPAAAADQGPGGPILVVAGANPFGRYYAEILRAEGLNAFDVHDIGAVTPPCSAATTS